MIGRRCSICAVNWPDEALYVSCPCCLEPTDRAGNLTALDSDQARSRVLHHNFERYYARRDALRSDERRFGAAEPLDAPPSDSVAQAA